MDTDPGGRRFAAAEGPDSPVFAFKAQLAIACDSLRLLAIYALLAWAFRRFSQAVQRSAAVKRQVACTCMYLHVPATLSLSVRVQPAAAAGLWTALGRAFHSHAAAKRLGEGGSSLPPRPPFPCKMSKNRRVSAAHAPYYHGLMGIQHLFSIYFSPEFSGDFYHGLH